MHPTYVKHASVHLRQGRRQRGHWAMPPLGAESALWDCLAPPQLRMFYRENVVGGISPFSGLRAPEGALRPEKFLRKIPP